MSEMLRKALADLAEDAQVGDVEPSAACIATADRLLASATFPRDPHITGLGDGNLILMFRSGLREVRVFIRGNGQASAVYVDKSAEQRAYANGFDWHPNPSLAGAAEWIRGVAELRYTLQEVKPGTAVVLNDGNY